MAKSAFMMVLLASAALVAPLSRAAAESEPATTAVATSATTAAATDSIPTPTRTTVEDVTVTARRSNLGVGGGLIKPQVESKSVSTVSSAFIQTQSSIQNAYQYVQLTPGALVAMSDPFGLAEQFTINIRGLGQDELGYVLEGMPLNDIGFYSAFPSQFIDSENIDEVSLEQGSADLDSPVISAAGGLMKLTMLDPSVRPGGNVDISYGSYNTNREFLRLDSGLIGDTGVRAFASYSHTDSDQWRGEGVGHRDHADFKFVKEWDDGNRVTLSGEWHDGITPFYLLPTLADFKAKGSNYNYESKFTPGDGSYWRLNQGTFRIAYFAAPAIFKPTENLTVNLTPYYQYGYGNSPYGTALSEDGNFEGTDGGPTGTGYHLDIPNYAANGGVVEANYTDLQHRVGVVGKLTYTTGFNSIIAGFWQDYADEVDVQSYNGVSATGDPGDIWALNATNKIRLPDGRQFLAGEDHVITITEEPFLADVMNLFDDKLRIEVGVKYALVSRNGTNGVPGPQYRADIFNTEALPRMAVRYKIDDHDQVFASVTTNFRTPSEATFFDEYYGGSIYAGANTNLKPEYSTEEEVGYRYTNSMLTGSVTLFNYFFTNRQIATIGFLPGGSQVSLSTNAGAETSRGVDLELGTQRWHHFSLYGSAEYLDARIDNNLPDGGDFLPTAGKTAIRSPKDQVGLGLSYDDGTFFANLNVKYVDKQFSTQMNDESIPAYATVDLGIGARLPSYGLRARPEIKLNLINLNNGAYLGGVASPTLNAQTQIGIHNTVLPGSAPTYFETAGLAAIFTASQAF